MSFEVVALNAARFLTLTSILAGAISIAYIIFRIVIAQRKKEIGRSDRPLIISALLGSFATSVAIAFVAAEYSETQAERKQTISSLAGISKEIDKEIKISSTSRVSFFHKNALLERASVTCVTLSSRIDGKLPPACGKTISEN
jgi:ABC-type transport system involved in cytochrome bd biosynthesis fused ATPase/permease subunit